MANPKRSGGVPPLEHRFKPGQSGNPGGRPKKQPTLRETTQARLARLVWILVDGKRQQVPRFLIKIDRLAATPKPF